MSKPISAIVVLAALISFIAFVAQGNSKPAKSAPDAMVQGKKAAKILRSRAAIMNALEGVADVKPYVDAGEITFDEFLGLLEDKMRVEAVDLPLVIDFDAFRDEFPDLDLHQAKVQFPRLPRIVTVEQILRFLAAKVPTNNAAIRITRDRVEITTDRRASAEGLLDQRILARYEKKPLAEVLNDLSEMTGATILLDERAGERRNTKVTAHFNSDVSLRGVLRTLSEMAGLKMTVVSSVIFVTTPEHAAALAKEDAEELKRGRERAPE